MNKLFNKKSAIISAVIVAIMILSVFLVSCNKKPQEPKVDPKVTSLETVKKGYMTKADAVKVTDSTVTFKDDSGRDEITIKRGPKKVMILYASLTTLWYENGGSAYAIIGGKSSQSLYKSQIGRDITVDKDIIVVAESSAASQWNTESIMQHEPDLIISAVAMSGYKTIAPLAEAKNIPVIGIAYNSFQDYIKWSKVFSAINNTEKAYQDNALKVLDNVANIITEVPTTQNPKVLALFASPVSIQANLKGTVVGDMLSELKAINIAQSESIAPGTDRVNISLETIVAANPAYIVVQNHAGAKQAEAAINNQFGKEAAWKSIDAVKNGKIFYLDTLLFHNKPNKLFVKAYQDLAKMIYPDHVFSFEK